MMIYVASSWRNLLQPAVVTVLRKCGHNVYDFRHPYYPAPDSPSDGFRWEDIDKSWQSWTPQQYREALQHRIVKAGYANNITALRSCDACVLVLPSGRSASWEFGYAMALGKRGYVVQMDSCEPELMYQEATIITSMDEQFTAFWEVEYEL